MKKGFTLIEVLVIITIIGIVSFMVIGGYLGYKEMKANGTPSAFALINPEYAKAQAFDRMAAAQEEQNRLLKQQLQEAQKSNDSHR